MTTDALPIDTTTNPRRAGFWRRWLALLIDWIIVVLPFQVLAAILFVMTAGGIQMNDGFFRYCTPATTVPQALNPPPPHDSNFAGICHVSFFGATTGLTLTVGRTTREGNRTTTVSQNYMLDRDEKPINGTSIDWIVVLVFLGYVFVMISKTGRTVGARAIKTRVVDVSAPGAPGVSPGKIVIRFLVMIAGAMPMFAVVIHQLVAKGGNADAMFTADFFQWFIYAGLIAALWTIVLTVQIAGKRDPYYDRLAGTAVLRD
jgi:uncharacterized RDD family membrane protein YckC